MNEAVYQRKLIKKLQKLFPECMVLKNDPSEIQGIPDILILFGDKWIMLELKESVRAPNQPNQEYYVERLNNMSYAAFIYPENEEQVLEEIKNILGG